MLLVLARFPEKSKVGITSVVKTVRLSESSEDTTIGGLTLLKKVENRDGYYVITEHTRDEEDGVVDRRVETKNRGALTITTVTELGGEFTADEDGVVISARSHTFQDFPAITKVFAKGQDRSRPKTKRLAKPQ